MKASSPALVLAIALAATTACKKKSDEAPAREPDEAKGASATEGPAPGSPARRKADQRRNMDALRSRLNLEPVTIDEVKALIPKIAGATPVGQPGVAAGGRQVKAVYCVAGQDTEKVKTSLVAGLTAAGWQSARARPHPRTPNIQTVSAEKTPFRVAGTVQRGPYPDCQGTEDKTKVILSFFKRGTATPAVKMAEPPAAPAPAPATPPTK